MNELFDKLILRVVFALFICLTVFLYKYAHSFLYPSARLQLFRRFYPSQNPAYTLHFFSRLIGIGIIFSEFYFHMSEGIVLAISDFLLQSTLAFFLYLVSIYIVESIALYNFEYRDEILRKKNMSYALICFTHSLCVAFIVRTVLIVSKDSLIVLLLLWPFAIVIIGFAIKSYRFISKLAFNKLLLQKNIAMALSYTGFFWGWVFIICSAMPRDIIEIRWYAIKILLKILLSLIIFPVIQKTLIWIFRIKDDYDQSSSDQGMQLPKIGHGIYEGSLFFTSCYLTSVITGNIQFGSYYPAFP